MTFAITAAGVAAVGVGVSAASAAGAFSGEVDKLEPTPEELEAAEWNRQVYALGRRIQNPLDKAARQDLAYLQSPQALATQGGLASSQAVGQISPQLQQAQLQAAQSSGGPGSGRWAANLAAGSAALDASRRSADASARANGLSSFVGRTGQFLGRRGDDLQSGLASMTQGGQQAADALRTRIQAQVANNIAANQAMGQLGGSLIGMGMGGLGATGALSGLGGAAGSLRGAETGLSVFQPALQSVASQYNLAGAVP